MTETELPAGYRIREAGVPGSPTQYQVVHGSNHNLQVVGVRMEREEATQLAVSHHNRVQAERSAALNRPPTPSRAPRR